MQGNRAYQHHTIDEHINDEPRWLWRGFIPFGRVTVLDGASGRDNSLVATDIVARITAGRHMPDGTQCEPGNAVMLCADDIASTVVPRLEAAGADLRRIVLLESDPLRRIVLPRDVILLTQHVLAVQAKLLVIDPLMTYLDPDVNPLSADELEMATAPLDLLAVASGVALLLVRGRGDCGDTWPVPFAVRN